MEYTEANEVQQSSTVNLKSIAVISLVATIGGFLFGFDSGVINGTVEGLKSSFNSNSVGTGFNVASMLLGCAVGAFLAGRLADIWGRKAILMIAAVFFIISAWGSGIANTSFIFVVFRIIGGLAVGAASVIAPAYISEIAPAHLRGRFSSIQQVAIITGLFTAFLSNFFVVKVAGGSTETLWLGFDAWRWMFWIELIPAIAFLLLLFKIPESPRYLVMSGDSAKAEGVMAGLIGKEDASLKVKEIENTLAGDGARPKFSEIFAQNKLVFRPIIWLGIGLAVLQQLVGINVVFYYGAVLWQSVGFSETDALLINVITGAVSILACVIALTLVDKWGRKPLLLVGSIGMFLSLSIMSWAFFNAIVAGNGDLSFNGNMGLYTLLAANIYVFFFNLSWGPVMWVMLGEMFPNKIRGSGLAVSGLFQWIANFGITMTFPIMLVVIGLGGAYAFYALSALVSIFFVWRFVRETKGVELEDMQG